jgi:hypothetical protein
LITFCMIGGLRLHTTQPRIVICCEPSAANDLHFVTGCNAAVADGGGMVAYSL